MRSLGPAASHAGDDAGRTALRLWRNRAGVAQAGLSWLTILRRREEYRRVFAGFDPHRLARWGERHIARALADPGIVRNRLKVTVNDHLVSCFRYKEVGFE